MKLTVNQAIEKMTETANELKSLFPASAVRPGDGMTYHSQIDAMLADHSKYINRLTIEQTLRRFNGDAERLRNKAAKLAKNHG